MVLISQVRTWGLTELKTLAQVQSASRTWIHATWLQNPGTWAKAEKQKGTHNLCDIVRGIHYAGKKKQPNWDETGSPTQPMTKKGDTQILSQLQQGELNEKQTKIGFLFFRSTRWEKHLKRWAWLGKHRSGDSQGVRFHQRLGEMLRTGTGKESLSISLHSTHLGPSRIT